MEGADLLVDDARCAADVAGRAACDEMSFRGRATGGAVAWMVVYGGVLFFERYPYAEVEVELEWFFLVGVVAALSGSGSCPRRGSLI